MSLLFTCFSGTIVKHVRSQCKRDEGKNSFREKFLFPQSASLAAPSTEGANAPLYTKPVERFHIPLAQQAPPDMNI